MSTRSEAGGPVTLMQAHELLTRLRPGPSASPKTWLSYYQRSAAVYAEVAETDRGHHHEALYWAQRERAKANTLARNISRQHDNPTTKVELPEDHAERS
jgi:hypothetical protein